MGLLVEFRDLVKKDVTILTKQFVLGFFFPTIFKMSQQQTSRQIMLFFVEQEKKNPFPFTTAADKLINLVPQHGVVQRNKMQII